MLAILNNQAHNGNGGFKPFPVGWSLNVAPGSYAGDSAATQANRYLNNWRFNTSLTYGNITHSGPYISQVVDPETDQRHQQWLILPTNKTITKSVAFWCGGHFKTGTHPAFNTWCIGLLNLAQLEAQMTSGTGIWPRKRCGFNRSNSTTVRCSSINANGTAADYDDQTTIADNTEYWWRMTGDGSGDIKFDFYSTLALWKAAGNGDVATTTLDVSGGDFSADRFGIIKFNQSSTGSETVLHYWFDGDVCDWY